MSMTTLDGGANSDLRGGYCRGTNPADQDSLGKTYLSTDYCYTKKGPEKMNEGKWNGDFCVGSHDTTVVDGKSTDSLMTCKGGQVPEDPSKVGGKCALPPTAKHTACNALKFTNITNVDTYVTTATTTFTSDRRCLLTNEAITLSRTLCQKGAKYSDNAASPATPAATGSAKAGTFTVKKGVCFVPKTAELVSTKAKCNEPEIEDEELAEAVGEGVAKQSNGTADATSDDEWANYSRCAFGGTEGVTKAVCDAIGGQIDESVTGAVKEGICEILNP